MKYFRTMSRQRRRQVGFDMMLSILLIAATAVYAPVLWDWLPKALAGEEAASEQAGGTEDDDTDPPEALGFVTPAEAGDPPALPVAEDAADPTEPAIELNRRLAPDLVLRLQEDSVSTFELGIIDGRLAPVQIVIQPELGTVTRRGNGEWIYRPDENTNGLDELSYRVCIEDRCEDGFVLLTIAGLNDPPVAEPDQLTVAAGQTGIIDPLLNDTDPDTIEGDLTVTAVGLPLHGTAALHPDGTIEYRAPGDIGENTSDSFTYVVCDPQGGCTAASVTIAFDL
ncbi:MAG: hypothetical protein GY698_14695 [Actinomycetia bacterium]|nr:hypothetical protein [Actinomycetes bacterium]